MKSINVVIVDDHEVVRLGLMTLFEDIDWINVVAEAGSTKKALLAVKEHSPDIVILDINLPGESGIIACQQITSDFPETKVIMLTSFLDDKLIVQALQAGASGYVLKQVRSDTIIDALEAVRQGNSLLDPVVTQRMISRVRANQELINLDAFKELTKRELEVLFWITKGMSNGQIAEEISISRKTVGHHVSNILLKLNMNNRVEAAIFASDNQISSLFADKKFE